MGKTYETPELVAVTLELGVFGTYGDSGGGDDEPKGGHGHGDSRGWGNF